MASWAINKSQRSPELAFIATASFQTGSISSKETDMRILQMFALTAIFAAASAGASACSSTASDNAPTNAYLQQAVMLLAQHPGAKSLPIARTTQIVQRTSGFEYGQSPSTNRLLVTLPARAAGAIALTRHEGSLRVRLVGARDASAGAAVQGMLVYRDALGPDIHVFHRPLAAGGDEELVYFARPPNDHSVEYAVDAPTGVR